jgi:stage V sporulation protein D (sporulation-specific penicillin-binding protein)
MVICTALFLLLILLLLRVGYVQLIQGNWLTKQAENLWQRDIAFSPPRGSILDRNMKPLVYNVSVPSVLAIPAQIKDPKETAKQLAPILVESEEKLYNLITSSKMMVWIKPQGKRISDEKAVAINKLNLPGIVVTDDSKRYYPHGHLAAHLLGFTGIDNQGLSGLELIYDKLLTGKPGFVSISSNAYGDKMKQGEDSFSPPRPGLDIVLSIDREIQTTVEHVLDQAVAEYQPDDALAIAVKPSTGEILALSSRPTFRPDRYKDVDQNICNRIPAVWKTFEPGSSFKVITLAAALNEKKVDLQDRFHDSGSVAVGGAKLRCWKAGGHGSQTYLEVVQNSCNPGFVNLGQKLGKEVLFDYLHKFGFGSKTGVDLSGESAGILFPMERIGPVELATTAFGQGISTTPIQQIMAISACVNGGKLMKPYIVKGWADHRTHKLVHLIEPEEKGQVITKETSRTVCDALEHVVAHGTGRQAFLNGYRVMGKTATAQIVGPNGKYMAGKHIVSFICMAPSDNPEITFYIAVNNPKGIQFGGVVAAPLAKRALSEILPYLGVKRRKIQVEALDTPMSTPVVTVPDLIGKTKSELQRDLSSGWQLITHGEGTIIQDQLPKPGEKTRKGNRIHIYTEN